MEVEEDGKLPFLDVSLSRNADGTLGHTVYRTLTHTNRYLNKDSNHHPRQKRGIIKTLVERARRICDPEDIEKELKHLEEAFIANGYSSQEIKRAIRPNRHRGGDSHEKNAEQSGFACLPYIHKVTDRIGKLLEKKKVKTVFKPTKKIQQSLGSVKDKNDPLVTPGVYRIRCTCGQLYIGTTRRSISTRIGEHKRHCRLGHTEKSEVAEHAFNDGNHRILFEETEVLDNTQRYFPRLTREAIEIHKHQENFNMIEETAKLKRYGRALRSLPHRL
ncbi:hypothetical protein NQ315_013739 [Exocentrus adspersus]|uniref:GIY-YIG domain-containing protein n=1 Tax=Exocentrus adspersus TaxID=1586481 RepID=A0AAV8W4M3_9CUCU|nr:hypothetical protein NQ315_013739 [Exocentrus adspersus]